MNQKQLVERAHEIFPNAKVIPVVDSLEVDKIDVKWIEDQMKEFDIKRNDLVNKWPLISLL